MTLARGHGTLMRLRCARCGGPFLHLVTRGSDPAYCSDPCRRAAARSRANARAEAKKAEEHRRAHRPRVEL